eukprot:5035911-Lingulodinium_polyedra.AAC.1
MVATCSRHNQLRYQCDRNPLCYEITLAVKRSRRDLRCRDKAYATLSGRCVWDGLQVCSGVARERRCQVTVGNKCGD